MATKRINVTLEEESLSRIDRFAEETGISRSAAITVLTAQALEYKQLIAALPGLMDYIQSSAPAQADPPRVMGRGGP